MFVWQFQDFPFHNNTCLSEAGVLIFLQFLLAHQFHVQLLTFNSSTSFFLFSDRNFSNVRKSALQIPDIKDNNLLQMSRAFLEALTTCWLPPQWDPRHWLVLCLLAYEKPLVFVSMNGHIDEDVSHVSSCVHIAIPYRGTIVAIDHGMDAFFVTMGTRTLFNILHSMMTFRANV
jgi:hypothetical protein